MSKSFTGGVRAPDVPPHVARRAVEWLVELQSGTASESARRGWQEWLVQHDDHARAWRHIETVNASLRGNGTASTMLARATLTAPCSLKRRAAVKTLAALFFVGGTAWVAREQAPWREWIADERTAVGERRHLTLPDGTAVALNTDTAISLRYTETERRFVLLRGEIMVTTARDPQARPFLVETAQGELQPLGTRFTVYQKPVSSHLAVYEGAVRIVPRDDAAGVRVVQSGEQAEFTGSQIASVAAAQEGDAAWSEGMIVASGMRLEDFVAQLSRHRRGRIGCDPQIADLRVSGTYPLEDTDRVLGALSASLPVRPHFITRYWVTLRPEQPV
ncbi:sensor [Oxalicibacterium flavum]|uniref:Sensor n=1 Tax=Oxalicibacterium flavum TaxID=179467 RepID=A0A8J2ULE5_9BURK|nr:FecR domain-containing protein [Oxalicibacterium flavum]GGC12748.1 sensor [Oxalicibacterium flavum]